MGKFADDAEVKEMGREVASSIVKGAQGVKVHPSDAVPLATLVGVAAQHGVTELDPRDFGMLAKSMEEALEEAARWEETTAPAS